MQVQVKKTMRSKGERDSLAPNEDGNGSPRVAKGMRAPTIRRSKLLIVDLAGSERVDKSGRWPLDLTILFELSTLCTKLYQEYVRILRIPLTGKTT